MKKLRPINNTAPGSLPFAFIKEEIDEEKIKAHWKKIKEKIKKELPGSTGDGRDNSI